MDRGFQSNFARRLAAAVALMACGVAAAASAAAGANQAPDAGFAAVPGEPFSGETVRFVSYGCDPDGRLTEQAWDLDGDGGFDDAFGPEASRAFSGGDRLVALRVTDDEGRATIRRRILNVAPGRPDYVLPRPRRIPLLSPFPIVRVAGSVTAGSVRIRRLIVRAPVCSRVTVRCRGESCPFRRSTRVMGRRAMRFRALERVLAPGTVLEVLVRKRDRIGKYTRLRLREGRPPARQDLCLRFDANRGTRCPSD